MKTTSIKELLAQYNERAATAGVPTLKAWKGSKAQLEAKLGELDHEVLSIAQIAAELKLTPKVVRGKLRRAGMKAVDGRWPAVRRGSPEYAKIIAALVPAAE